MRPEAPYQRPHCTALCPRRAAPEAACGLCRVLDERDRFWDWLCFGLPWWLWDLSGVRAICAKVVPTWKAASEPRPSTFLLWIVGIYAALFGIAAQRYENHIDRIEVRANGIYAQLGSSQWKEALERIPRAQAMTRPKQPELLKPWSVLCSLYFCEQERDTEMVETLRDVILTFKENLEGVDLRGVDLSGANLRRANLVKADLRMANFKMTDFLGANLMGADLRKARFGRTDFREANLEKVNLRETNLRGAHLDEANLREADLYKANLYKVNLNEANLFRTFLMKADLESANLTQATLNEANLREANLTGASLYGAWPIQANLNRAKLLEANLRAANLREANLRETNLYRIRGVKNATEKQFSVACIDHTTKIPEALTPKEIPTKACEYWDQFKRR